MYVACLLVQVDTLSAAEHPCRQTRRTHACSPFFVIGIMKELSGPYVQKKPKHPCSKALSLLEIIILNIYDLGHYWCFSMK
jgi:hypothetical protein